jgi:Mg-chelatase subunit ChlD
MRKPKDQGTSSGDSLADDLAKVNAESRISLADRWRMILGVPPENQPQCSGAAISLDQLFGRGRGEGSKGGLANRPASGTGGGTEAPMPTTAEWADDLEELFGGDVCQEVLGESAGMGNQVALDLLDPDTVTPSIELLQQVLSLAGGLAEVRAERMRRLAKRITERLAKQLAVRLRPAMSGLSAPRPTRRRSRRLNLPRTIRDNLVNAYRRDDGRPAIVAKSLLFNTQSRREMDWHLTFVVDVSGSMTTSVVYSALCAAIFSELPALSVRFLAFSTEVLDLSEHVTDPLALLLEVQVGGGTHIGLGLRAARAKLKVPSRSIVVLVSDFEEGVSVGEMLAEVRALTQSGARCVGLAALDDSGTARFHQGYAQMVAAAGMPVAAVSPERLADWVGDQIRGQAGQVAKSPVGTLLS